MARGKGNSAYYLQPEEDCADLDDLRKRFWETVESGAADSAGAAAAAPGSNRKRQGSADGDEAAAKKARTDGD